MEGVLSRQVSQAVRRLWSFPVVGCGWERGTDSIRCLYVVIYRLNKENIPSRAYIAFKDEELLATFSREYDGHIFRDKAGELTQRAGVGA